MRSQKNPKIKKTTMIGEKKEGGGLGMSDFDIINKSLKAAWAKRVSVPDCAMWKSLPLEYLRDVGREFIFYCNFSLKTLLHLSGLPLFYKDVFYAWERIVGHTPGSKNEGENENLKTYGDRAFSVCAPKLWNCLPYHIRCSPSVSAFKSSLKTYFFKRYFIS